MDQSADICCRSGAQRGLVAGPRLSDESVQFCAETASITAGLAIETARAEHDQDRVAWRPRRRWRARREDGARFDTGV